MGDKIAVVHAGNPKTGTTSIQLMISQNLERFGAIHYPAAGRPAGYPHMHHNIAWDTGANPMHDPRDGGLPELAEELRLMKAERVLLSSEEFSHWWRRPDLLTALRDVLVHAGYRSEIVLVLRDIPAAVESTYAELRKQLDVTAVGSFDEYVADVLAGTVPVRYGFLKDDFDYEGMVSGFEAVFGRDHVHLIEYDPDDAVGPFFAVCSRLFGIGFSPLPTAERLNPRAASAAAYRLSAPQRNALREKFGTSVLPGGRTSGPFA